jgi:hypothetical protein
MSGGAVFGIGGGGGALAAVTFAGTPEEAAGIVMGF